MAGTLHGLSTPGDAGRWGQTVASRVAAVAEADGLKSLDVDLIAVSLLTSDRPVRLATVALSGYFHVVLPLRPAG